MGSRGKGGASPGSGHSSPFGRFFKGKGSKQSGSCSSSPSHLSPLSTSGGAGSESRPQEEQQHTPKQQTGLSALFWGQGKGSASSSGEPHSSFGSSRTSSSATSSDPRAATPQQQQRSQPLPAAAVVAAAATTPSSGMPQAKVEQCPPTPLGASGPAGELLPSADESLLCILDVAYAPGQVDQINVRVGDKASDLAAAFAAKHGLDASTRGVLEEYISRSVADLLCVLDVAYAEGEVDRIPVHVGDAPAELAAAFAAKHGLDAEAQGILEAFIAQSIEQHMAAHHAVEQEAAAATAVQPAVRPAERGEEYAYEEAKGGEYPPSPSPSSHQQHDGGEALFNRLKQAWRSPISSSSRRTRPAGAVPYTPPHSPSSAGRSSVPAHPGRSAGAPSLPVGQQLQSHLRSYSPTGAGMSPAAGGRRRRTMQPSGFRGEQRADIVPGGKVKRAAWGELVDETPASDGVPEACERLYAEAVALRRRREEAVARRAYLEQKERRQRRTAVLQRVREVLGVNNNGSAPTDFGREDNWGQRLYLQGRHLQQRRLELWRPRPTAEEENDEAYQDWVCPKCSHTNPLAATTCQRVTGRSGKSLADLAPTEWASLPADTVRLHGRRIAEQEEILRCSQPRPPLFHPTIVSLQEYEPTYGKPLPVAVRLRPKNVFEELYSRRFLADQKLKALKLQREESEAEECTFAPVISERSRVLVEARERSMMEGELGLTSAGGSMGATLGEDSEAWAGLSPEERRLQREMRKLQRAEAMHRGGYVRKHYHANCAAQPRYSFIPTIGVDRYWTPPTDASHPHFSAAAVSPRPDAEAGGEQQQQQQQPLLHRKPRQDDSVFVRLTEEDSRKRERNLAALTKEVRRHETFMPETTGMVPSKQRVLDKEEGSGGDVCAHLYQEGMAALERKKEEEARRALQVRQTVSAKYTRGLSEALVRVMKGRAYITLFRSLFPVPEAASKETRLDLETATLERVAHPDLLKALVLVLGREGNAVAERAMREKTQAQAITASKDPGWSQLRHTVEKKGPHAPGQFLAKPPTANGGARPTSPTPKPSMLPTGGFPANASTHPTAASSNSSTGAETGLLLGNQRRTLGFDEFTKRLDHFLLPAGIPGPGFLYTHACDAEKEGDKHLTFRPRINPRSAELVAGRWAQRSRKEVFDLLHAEGGLKVQRLEEARREKASHLLDECTFQPFLFTYRGGGGQPPRYHYPDSQVWVQQQQQQQQQVTASPRSRSAFAVERRGRFDAPRARSTIPVRLAGRGVYNREHTPTHDWPERVTFGRGRFLRAYLDTHDEQDPGRKAPVFSYRPPTVRPGSRAPLRDGGRGGRQQPGVVGGVASLSSPSI